NYSEGKIIFGFDSKINTNEVIFSNITFKNNFSQNVNNKSNYTGGFSYKKGEFKDSYKLNPYSFQLSFGDGREQNIDVVATNNGFINNLFIDFSNVNLAPLLQLDSDLIFDLRLIGNNNGYDINSYRGNINLYDKSLTTKTEEVAVKASNRITGTFLWKTLSLIPFINISGLETSSTTNRIINVVSATNLSLTSNISVDGNKFSLSSLNLKAGDLKISNANINLDTKLKEFNVDSSLSYLKHSKNTNQNSLADLSFSLNFATFFDNIKELYYTSVIDENSKLDYKKLFNKLKELFVEKRIALETFNGINGHVKLDNIKAFKDTKAFEKLWPDTLLDNTDFSMIDSTYKVENSKVKIEGINLNGSIDLINKDLRLDVNKDFGIGLNAEYNYSEVNNNLMLKNLYIPTNLISKILYFNIMKIYGGALTGDLQIVNLNTNPKFYGSLNIDKSNVKLLWIKNQEATLHNASLIAFGNDIVIRNAKFDVYNADTNTTSSGLVDFNISYIKGTPFSISIGVNINDYVFGIFPMRGNKIWSEGYTKGKLEFIYDNRWSYLNGGLIVKDAIIKGELEPLPSWLTSSDKFSVNIELQTGSNVTVYYPTIDNPILKATLNKNQNFSLNIDNKEGKTSAEGKVSIAQGELFYFQKNFFINSGSITFGQDLSTNKLQLLLSLNATLKEYDSEGNDIDIKMILNNSSLDNLNPVFSSSPAKSNTEIMSILGQSVTGISSGGSLQVSGLATAATSIFSTLGYINTSGIGSLNQTIAKTLNLDIFSLNSNIVENLLLDTLSVENSSSNYSPLARYLDNTSIYMGKYISTDSYLQLIINLLAEKDSKQSSFLASDLKLDFEVTYDIDTPLARFSIFTNPQQLSIIDILDTIGFSVTKTIYLR
ncbi:MAG: translocation/assembly module TamB domain-containing protein, partial [Spirochaetaceae bacterium]|nr:translocation/assembly module TamB domain-containing protein [Spirochaetaceae bacterium]